MPRRNALYLALAVSLAFSAVARAQVPVRFTAAIEHRVRPNLRLTGTVEARRTAVLATEVAGIVDQLLAPEGSEVQRGSPLARLRRDAIELRSQAAAGQLAEAEARLKSAELKLERTRELQGSEVVSRQQVDDAAYDSEAWQGRVAQLRAEVARLERDLENTTIRAAFSGVVGQELCQVGEWVDVGDPVVELISLDTLEVRLEVPERRFGDLVAGSPARVRFEALPEYDAQGTIRTIVPRADARSRTFPVLVRLPSSGRRVGVGMLAQVDLEVGAPVRATLVPKDAVVTRDRQSHVYIADDGSAVRRVAVEPGTAIGQWIAVHGEVVPGDRVVTRGNERLADGQAVAGSDQSYPLPGSPSESGS
ncbi:MAG: efflux RND transporter periplasmic adaptor subunit [Acidobacteriota bacterium]